jgi:sugar/nucleoside kinase (ribokinase family)
MLSDRGDAPDFRLEELDPSWLEGCDHLFVSGYALLRGPVRETALAAVEIARRAGARVSVDLASWSAIEESGADVLRTLLAELSPDVVFANEAEDRVVGGSLPGVPWILKRGPRGCSFDGQRRAPVGCRRRYGRRRRPRCRLDRRPGRPRAPGPPAASRG